ncbi:hypothetical protein [Ureibacillus sp. GCM10028918]|uniref:SF0329 family protein n=1 Tax=Ureibacillus sp. GCM10028918 TaxID=3273429 RepID=UPI0036245382
MRWTKTKSLIENLICGKLTKRLKVNATRYNTSLGEQRRIWITLDNKEIFNASSAHFLNEHDKLWDEIRNKSSKSFPECLYECFPELIGKVSDSDYSKMILEQRNIFNVDKVYDSLVQYSNLSIEDALNSEDIIVQSLALIDKRLGKRRLENFKSHSDTHPLLLTFFHIRCEIEEISTPI